MKYKRVELASDNNPQYVIALGVRDIELMLGEAKNAARYIPRDAVNAEDHQRLDGIVKGLTQALDEARGLGDEGGHVPTEDRHKFRSEYLKGITRLELIDHRPCKHCGGGGWLLDGKGINPSEHPGPFQKGKKPIECGACAGGGVAGRNVIFWDQDVEVKSSVQDEGRTLKLFVQPREK